jgi:ribonuclease P protein component
MFAKKNRLSKTKDIQKAFTRGRGFFYPYFGVKFLTGLPPSRFTVVVSNKISKSAVKRNRLKRIIREILRLNVTSLKPGDYMVLVRPAALKATPAELRQKVLQGLKIAKLLT